MSAKNDRASQGARHRLTQMLDWMGAPSGKAAAKPYVSQRGAILSLHFNEDSTQSEMNMDAPDELVLAYTRAMMSFLLLQPSPQRIAMIGLGGGSMAKYCYRYLPHSDITVVEIDADVIALRDDFLMPPDDARLRVLLADGAEWIRETETKPEILVVDGFDAQGLPEPLSSQDFYDACHAALSEQGILVVNLWSGYPNYDEYVARIRNSFEDRVLIVDAEDKVNKIVLAMKDEVFPPTAATLRHHAKLLAQRHTLNFQAKVNRLIQALSR
jgi:spermidine synthase